MDADARTSRLFREAVHFAGEAYHKACEGFRFPTTSDQVPLAAARIQATATIFAALVEHDLAEQIRSAREQVNAG